MNILHYAIKKRHYTQKSSGMGEEIASFIIDKKVTKKQIKHHFNMMGVEVISVNTLIMPKKIKTFRGKKGCRSSFKKAVVRFKDSAPDFNLINE